jgi:GST-like protein
MDDAPAQPAALELYAMGSPNVRKILLMLEELETPYDLRYVRVFKGEQFSPAYRALNPLSKVPVLIDRSAGGEGYPVFESGAILIYLAEKFGRFLPSSGEARYETLKWLFAQTSNVGPMLGQFNHFRLQEGEQHAYALERYLNISVRLLKVLDERLQANRFLAGEDYTIADIATYHWAGYVDNYAMDWKDFPHLARWRGEIGARPAAQRELVALKRLAGGDTLQAASSTDLDRFFWRD